jgi:hypothetical protein
MFAPVGTDLQKTFIVGKNAILYFTTLVSRPQILAMAHKCKFNSLNICRNL